jgi:hypothetical protein
VSMASAYDKYYEQQPGPVKVIVVAGLALLGYSIYRGIKRRQEERDLLKAAQAANSELAQLANQGVHPTYNDSQFEAFSVAIDGAVAGCGTDEEAIFSVFRAMKNEADIRKLISVFGVRYLTPCVYSDPVSYSIWLANHQAYPGDLASFLATDLSSGDVQEINEILKSNGIEYQF